MRALLISYYTNPNPNPNPNPKPNPNPNLIECTKNYSCIKTLTVVPHALRVVSNTILIGLYLTRTLRYITTKSTWYQIRAQDLP